jgi:hypothetical protein
VLVIPSYEEETLRLPDSGLPDLVIAPDLSNLPEGMLAEDLATGATVADTGELRAITEHPPAHTDGRHHHHHHEESGASAHNEPADDEGPPSAGS